MEPVSFSSLDSFEEAVRKLEDTAQQLVSIKPDFEQVRPPILLDLISIWI